MTYRKLYNLSFVFLLLFASACNLAKRETDADRKYLVERVDNAAIVQLYADGFEALALREKILIYHLSNAAVAGRDIFIDQKYKHSLAIRDLLETIITHPAGIDAPTLQEIERYTKLFWINNGPHNAITARKEVLRCSSEELTRATMQAVQNGAKLSLAAGETVDEFLSKMQPILFDPNVDAFATNKTPHDGKDILEASANNFYDGVTTAELHGFKESYPLNSKLVRNASGQLEEVIWRAGFDDVVPSGMYAKQLQEVIKHLNAAIPYATPEMAKSLALLVHFYKTGDPITWRDHNIAWVEDKNSPVDTINGFIEVYVDARGQKGAWEGIVYFNDPIKMDMIQKFSQNAQWFEDRMPYDPQYRKPVVKGISAKAIQVVTETGDSGPVTPIGINLPNAQDVREEYGSKSVSLSNVIEAYDKSQPSSARAEFCWDDAEFQRSEKWQSIAHDLEVNMHEVIGHASGRLAETLQGEPEDHIKEFYSALEEARADLVALYFIGNEQLAEFDLTTDPRTMQLAAYEAYTRNAMEQLRRMPEGSQIEEDHMRNRQMIVHWIMDNTKAIEVRHRDNKTFYVVSNQDEWFQGVGQLLKEVQRIKSEGDYEAAKDLFEKYGIHFDPKLRDEVLARYAKLDKPAYTGFVMPKLTPIYDGEGKIKDVEITYPKDLQAQMLEWSGRNKQESP